MPRSMALSLRDDRRKAGNRKSIRTHSVQYSVPRCLSPFLSSISRIMNSNAPPSILHFLSSLSWDKKRPPFIENLVLFSSAALADKFDLEGPAMLPEDRRKKVEERLRHLF